MTYFAPATDVRFMVQAQTVTSLGASALPGITHVDGTARPQHVHRASDPLYHELLLAIGQRNEHPVVLNTSFNVQGMPIALGAEDAFDVFASTGLDGLAIGPYFVSKR